MDELADDVQIARFQTWELLRGERRIPHVVIGGPSPDGYWLLEPIPPAPIGRLFVALAERWLRADGRLLEDAPVDDEEPTLV